MHDFSSFLFNNFVDAFILSEKYCDAFRQIIIDVKTAIVESESIELFEFF